MREPRVYGSRRRVLLLVGATFLGVSQSSPSLPSPPRFARADITLAPSCAAEISVCIPRVAVDSGGSLARRAHASLLMSYTSWPRAIRSMVPFPAHWPMRGCLVEEVVLFKVSWCVPAALAPSCFAQADRASARYRSSRPQSWRAGGDVGRRGVAVNVPRAPQLLQACDVRAARTRVAHLPPLPRLEVLLRCVSLPPPFPSPLWLIVDVRSLVTGCAVDVVSHTPAAPSRSLNGPCYGEKASTIRAFLRQVGRDTRADMRVVQDGIRRTGSSQP